MRSTIVSSLVWWLCLSTSPAWSEGKPAEAWTIPQVIATLKAETEPLDRIMRSRALRETPGTKAVAEAVRIGAPAIEPIAELLTDASPLVRRNAIWTLANLRDLKAEEAILPALSDRDVDVRKMAVSQLRTLTDAAIRKALIGALKDAQISVRVTAIRQLGFHAEVPPSHQQLSNVQRNELIDAVAALAREDHGEVRLEVARTLGSYQNSNALKPLLGLLAWISTVRNFPNAGAT